MLELRVPLAVQESRAIGAWEREAFALPGYRSLAVCSEKHRRHRAKNAANDQLNMPRHKSRKRLRRGF